MCGLRMNLSTGMKNSNTQQEAADKIPATHRRPSAEGFWLQVLVTGIRAAKGYSPRIWTGREGIVKTFGLRPASAEKVFTSRMYRNRRFIFHCGYRPASD